MFCLNKQLKTQIIILVRLVSIILIATLLPRICMNRISQKYNKMHAQVKKKNHMIHYFNKNFNKKHSEFFLLATLKGRKFMNNKA